MQIWPVTSNQMIKYQLSHGWFDQISNHKHGISNKFTKTRRLQFFKYGFRSDCPERFYTKLPLVEK